MKIFHRSSAQRHRDPLHRDAAAGEPRLRDANVRGGLQPAPDLHMGPRQWSGRGGAWSDLYPQSRPTSGH